MHIPKKQTNINAQYGFLINYMISKIILYNQYLWWTLRIVHKHIKGISDVILTLCVTFSHLLSWYLSMQIFLVLFAEVVKDFSEISFSTPIQWSWISCVCGAKNIVQNVPSGNSATTSLSRISVPITLGSTLCVVFSLIAFCRNVNYFWKETLLRNSFNVIFWCCDHWKPNSINLHCNGVTGVTL